MRMQKLSLQRIGQTVILLVVSPTLLAGEPDVNDPYGRDPDSAATTEAEMKPYRQLIRDTSVIFEMVPIPGGVFTMGSPEDEPHHNSDEGPQHQVKIDPFWMGKCEVTWNEFNAWRMFHDQERREQERRQPNNVDRNADAITRPTAEYTDMAFGMGHDGFPVVSMPQMSAKFYCHWLSAKTGHYYRLPTEAEWEYACRAGTTTVYSFGNDPEDLDEYAWYWDNSDEQYQKVGRKKPNPWGLHDMHGNVAEWCLDQYIEDFYSVSARQEIVHSLLAVPKTLYPRVVRGGSWIDDPETLRSAARVKSDRSWQVRDAQIPKSMWYHTEADFVGFRLVRPLHRPSNKEIREKVLYPDVPEELRKEGSPISPIPEGD